MHAYKKELPNKKLLKELYQNIIFLDHNDV